MNVDEIVHNGPAKCIYKRYDMNNTRVGIVGLLCSGQNEKSRSPWPRSLTRYTGSKFDDWATQYNMLGMLQKYEYLEISPKITIRLSSVLVF